MPYPLGYTRLFIKDNLFNKTTEPSLYSPILLTYSDTGKMKLSMKERPTYFSPWIKNPANPDGTDYPHLSPIIQHLIIYDYYCV